MLATTVADPNLNQVAEPEILPLFPNQQMELEPNQVDQSPIPAFDPNEIPRIPTPNPIAQYTDLNPLEYDPWWDDNRSYQELLNNPYPYEEPVPAPFPPMSQEYVQELR
ncbi:hypothetical protein Hanom_Chr16g01461811 [Helianthus anomalus]